MLSQRAVINEHTVLHTPSSALILIATEKCNLRCKYCVYSDSYPLIKSYSNKHMTFDVARKAIDYYMELHKERVKSGFKKAPAIVFYGGEPLMELGLIKQVVDYCRAKDPKTVFYITTNGTLIDDEFIRLAIENSIMVTVSLDGNEYEHDRKRVFKNGKGTFNQIIKNLTDFQTEKQKQGLEQIITFNSCYDSFTDICQVVDFFEEKRDMFSPFSVFLGEINPFYTNYYDDLDDLYSRGLLETDRNSLTNSMSKIRARFLDDIINDKTPSSTMYSIFLGLFFLKNRAKGIQPILNNSCIPTSKLSVDPDGRFYVCERVNQQFSIGDIDRGIDFDKVNRLVNEYVSLLHENCGTCGFSRLCEVCFMHFVRDNELVFNQEFCEKRRTTIPKILEMVYSTLEANPRAFDNLLDYSFHEAYEVLIK